MHTRTWTPTACWRPFLRGIRRAEAQRTPWPSASLACSSGSNRVEDNARWCDWILGAESALRGVGFGGRRGGLPCPALRPSVSKGQSPRPRHHRACRRTQCARRSARNILVALDELGADRIGHGVQAIHDDEVWWRLVRRGRPPGTLPLEQRPDPSRSLPGTPTPSSRLMERRRAHHPQHRRPRRDGHHPDGRVPQRHKPTLGIDPRGPSQQCNEWAREASFIPQDRIQARLDQPVVMKTPLPFRPSLPFLHLSLLLCRLVHLGPNPNRWVPS